MIAKCSVEALHDGGGGEEIKVSPKELNGYNDGMQMLAAPYPHK